VNERPRSKESETTAEASFSTLAATASLRFEHRSDRGRSVARLGYLDCRESLLGFPSSPRTTSHIGIENMRQMRSRVRKVMGFPASTFCQYRTEYPCDSMSSWL
jgi:hypothetical protein